MSNQPEQEYNTFFWVRDADPTTWYHDANLYIDNISNTGTPYSGEANSLYDTDPLFIAPAIPDTSERTHDRIAEIAATFAIDPASPAVDKGMDPLSMDGHPNWRPERTDVRWDILEQPRPAADTWDWGVVEVK